MTDNVVGLRGQAVMGSGPSNPDLVRLCEDLLEKAMSGEMQGILGAILYRDGSTGGLFLGFHSFSLVGRANAIVDKAARELEDAP